MVVFSQTDSAQSDHSDYLSDGGGGSGEGRGGRKGREILNFGTNVDLSDEEKWTDQLQELNKLPRFLRVREKSFNCF